MRVADNLLALEKVIALEKIIEQGIIGFFMLLGASEAPENWQAEWQGDGEGEWQKVPIAQDTAKSMRPRPQDHH